MAVVGTSAEVALDPESLSSSTSSSLGPAPPSSPSSMQTAVVAEPVTIFHYEVLTVGDAKVAAITNHLLLTSQCLIVVAIINFVIDMQTSGLSISTAIINLLVSLSLPACGIMGVKDRNLTCIQYFCCCTYFCAFLTFISIVSTVVIVANGSTKYWYQLVLGALFFAIYFRGGGLSQKLQEQPYFTQERLAPQRRTYVHQNTRELQSQPTAHAEFIDQYTACQPEGFESNAVVIVESTAVEMGGGGELAREGANGGSEGGGSTGASTAAPAVPVAQAVAVDITREG